MRATASVVTFILLGLVAEVPSRAQASFESATVRASIGSGMPAWKNNPTALSVKNAPLRILIQSAYQVREFQILGGPVWIGSDRYDIDAKVKGSPTRKEWSQAIGPMEQALLRERFKLSLHREKKELPVYSLTVAKDGLKLHPTRAGGCTQFLRSRYPISADQRWSPDYCGAVESGPNIRLNHTLDAVGMSISEGPDSLTTLLLWELNRFVIDHTGLSGLFDIRLEWNRKATAKAIGSGSRGDSSHGIPSFDDESPSIFTALEEQLGLNLEPALAPVEVLVIDHAEKPSGNP